ncbi:MAG: IclR family transcriptional regulator, partial [Acidimicrobiia bacterium]
APVEGETRRALLAAVARQRLLAVELDDSAGYRIADVIAPVFDAAGGVDLTLSLTVVDDRELRGAEVRALAGRVVEAADQLTGAICGRIPDVG